MSFCPFCHSRACVPIHADEQTVFMFTINQHRRGAMNHRSRRLFRKSVIATQIIPIVIVANPPQKIATKRTKAT